MNNKLSNEDKKILIKYWTAARSKAAHIFGGIAILLSLTTIGLFVHMLTSSLNVETLTTVIVFLMISMYFVKYCIIDIFEKRRKAEIVCETHFTPLFECSEITYVSMPIASLLDQKYAFRKLRKKRSDFTLFQRVESILILDSVIQLNNND